MPLTDREAQEYVARVDTMLEHIEALEDARVRETAFAAIQALMNLYGEGLSRIVGYAAECARRSDTSLADAFISDELVSHLLLLHGLHPDSLEDRVRGALDEVRPYLHSHGGNVELIEISNDVVQLRLDGSCKGCPSSSLTLRTAVEQAIRRAAPEVVRIEADGATQPADGTDVATFVPLTRVHPEGVAPVVTPLMSDVV